MYIINKVYFIFDNLFPELNSKCPVILLQNLAKTQYWTTTGEYANLIIFLFEIAINRWGMTDNFGNSMNCMSGDGGSGNTVFRSTESFTAQIGVFIDCCIDQKIRVIWIREHIARVIFVRAPNCGARRQQCVCVKRIGHVGCLYLILCDAKTVVFGYHTNRYVVIFVCSVRVQKLK